MSYADVVTGMLQAYFFGASDFSNQTEYGLQLMPPGTNEIDVLEFYSVHFWSCEDELAWGLAR